MTRIIKWSFRFFALLCVLALIAAIFFYYLMTRSLPDYDYSKPVSYGDYEAEIIRDQNAIPHIYGKNERDAYFALGFAHAQDRLWQMTMARRASQGRLSEVFGVATLEIDRFMRALDLWNLSKRNEAHLDENTLTLLNAYADGVNAYITELNINSKGLGAPEFLLFSREISPWTATDSIAVLKIMALQLSDAAENEIKRALLSTMLNEQEMADIFYETKLHPQITPLSRNERAALPPEWAQALSPDSYGREAGASNAFIAAPSRSASRAALLASDPHLPLTAPSSWMLAHISFQGKNIIGGTIPGIPIILIGHNQKLAWGLTTSYLDDQDLIILRRDPADAAKILTPNGSVSLQAENIEIHVKNRDDREIFTRITSPFGPIIPENGPWGVEQILPKDHLAALNWTALFEEDRTIAAGFALMHSEDVDAASAALKDHTAPAQMFSLADHKGNIAQFAAGSIPNRSVGNQSQGVVPAASWLGEVGFQDGFDYASTPRNINPQNGLLIHTNNKFIDAPYPHHFGNEWGDSYRIIRAQNLLGERRKFHTISSFIEAQNDSASEAAKVITSLIARPFWFQPGQNELRESALRMLANWNGEFDELRPEPLIYAAWVEELNWLLFSDEFGDLYEKLGRTDPVRIERIYRNVNGAARWCDIRPTPEAETCPEIAERALDEALSKLSGQYGDNIESWRWGSAHKALHENQVLGQIPLLGELTNIRQEIPGSGQTLLRAVYKGGVDYDFTAFHGAGLRMVVDFADLEHSKIIISTGQSGHILSKHYDDLSIIWGAGEYLDMMTAREIIEGNQIGRIRFTPNSK